MTGGPISSLANPRARAVARLRDRRERERAGLTLLDGPREIRRALEGGLAFREVLVSPRADRSLVAELADAGLPLVAVSEAVGARVGYGERDSGLVAVVVTPSTDLGHLDPPASPLLVVVEAIEKPGNLGAIFRSADAAGVDAVVVADPRTDPFNPNAIRASLGSILTLPLAVAPSAAVLVWLAERRIRPIVARVDAATVYTEVDLRGPVAIVFGAEDVGLSGAWDVAGVVSARLPMHGSVDSLNVSVAAAILLYEARRQRDAAGAGRGGDA
jgi:TrmH family RNA methyltransferase